MKKIFNLLVILAVSALLYAPKVIADNEANIYRAGITSGWVNYLEPGYISFYGIMFGAEAMAQLNYPSGLDLRFESSLLYGNIQYDGSVKDTVTGAVGPLKAGAYDYLFIGKAKTEFSISKSEASEYLVNAGVGLRYLDDRVNSTSGYEREITYVFLPLGGRYEYKISGGSVFGVDLEYDFFVLGKVKSHLSNTNPSNPDVTNTQANGSGYRVQLEYRFLWGSKSLAFKPYYQWWEVGASDSAPFTTGYILVEPRNSTSFGGLTIDIAL